MVFPTYPVHRKRLGFTLPNRRFRAARSGAGRWPIRKRRRRFIPGIALASIAAARRGPLTQHRIRSVRCLTAEQVRRVAARLAWVKRCDTNTNALMNQRLHDREERAHGATRLLQCMVTIRTSAGLVQRTARQVFCSRFPRAATNSGKIPPDFRGGYRAASPVKEEGCWLHPV